MLLVAYFAWVSSNCSTLHVNDLTVSTILKFTWLATKAPLVILLGVLANQL